MYYYGGYGNFYALDWVLGSWLLFAGPIYQAALELRDEDIQVDRIRAAGSTVGKQAKVSAWWWLVLPVALYLRFRNNKEYQRRFTLALDHEDLESMISFRNKASAWLFVAVGGFCIACKETFGLTRWYAWNNFILAGLIIGMLFLSIFNLIYNLKRSEKIIRLR